MKRVFLKTNKQYKAMENRDHFKNGTNSKRQTRRGKSTFLTIFLLILFNSCIDKIVDSDKEGELLENNIPVTGVTLNESSATIKIGSTVTLEETVAPQNATEKDITWTSSNSGVASVTDGIVTGVSAGVATITVTTKDGEKTATCQVTVTANDEDDPQLFILDISNESDWHYMIVGSDGSSIFFNVNEDTSIPTRLYFKPDKNSNDGFSMLFKDNGLPDKMIIEGHILYFGNFKGSKCDIALIYPDNTISYFYDIETDINWDDYTATSIQLRLFGINLKKAIDFVKHAVGVGSCVVGFTVYPGALGYCGSYLVNTLLIGTVVDAAIDLIIPDGFFNDLAHTIVDVIGCADPKFDISAKLDCASALVSTVELLSYIDIDLANDKNAKINEAIEKIEGIFYHEQALSVFVSGKDVYMAGYVDKYNDLYENYFSAARLWKNGIAQNFTDGINVKSSSSSVYVSNGDVYVAGNEKIGDKYFATLWKNGNAQHLADEASATSVFVSGSDVYVTGNVRELNGWRDIATLWKNGVAQNLSNELNEPFPRPNSVYVSGNDVYVAGNVSTYDDQVGILWKNGIAQYFYGDKNVNSVYISGSNVYMAGVQYFLNHNYSSAVLWKNGAAQLLTSTNVNTHASAHSVFVSGNNVYVAGYVYGNPPYTNSQRAVLWKNGLGIYLSTNRTVATSVYVSGNDVYIAGYEYTSDSHNFSTVAKLWKTVDTP